MSGISPPRSTSPVHSTSPTQITLPTPTVQAAQTQPAQPHSEQFAALRRSRSTELRSGPAQSGQGRRRTASVGGGAPSTTAAPLSLPETAVTDHDDHDHESPPESPVLQQTPLAVPTEASVQLAHQSEPPVTLRQGASESNLVAANASLEPSAPQVSETVSKGKSTMPVTEDEVSSSEAAVKETVKPLVKESEVSSSKAATKEESAPTVNTDEASSSEAAVKETDKPLVKESEVSSSKAATNEESTRTVKKDEASSSEAALKETDSPLVKKGESSSSKAVPEETSTPTTSSNAALTTTTQTHLTTPPPVHLTPSPTHLAPPPIRMNTTTPSVPAQPQQSPLSDPRVQNFIRHTRAITSTQTPASTMQFGTVGGRHAAGNTDIESGVPDTRTRLDQTRSRMAAFTTPARDAIAATPGALKAALSEIMKAISVMAKNEFGPDDPWKAWSATWANTMTHELFATGGTTIARELLSMLTEWAIKATALSPERQAFAVGTIFVGAAGANVIAMMHKKNKGTAISTTHRGHMLQITALLGSMAVAGAVGQGGENGQFGVLSTLLPAAIKSIAYLSRDLINLGVPLEGNHDAQYIKPVQGQATDGSYFLTEEAVNAGQDAAGLSGVGVLDAIASHASGVGNAVGKLFSYATLNAAGEGIANVSLRVANEISIHGFGSPQALQGIKDLRLHYGKYNSAKGSFKAQVADKMAGAGIARLSLFLSLYAVTGVIAYAFGNTSLGTKVQTHLEEAIGAALIIAGCIPFAMSTSSNLAEQEQTSATITEVPEDDTTPTVVADASGNLPPDATPPQGGLRPASAAGSVSSTSRRSFEVV
ncbi:hypothetical protein PQQ52_24900 [Paraburkholderia sediminicola]|uniref:hypothetical protein n=1 Tax=Paraburkholderia sediminicola TaxID=458836 RepID=UPI0038B8ABDE